MFKGKKVVVVVPAGRLRYMKLMYHYLNKQMDFIDELRFWVNTNNQDDIAWMKTIRDSNSKVTLDDRFVSNGNCGQSTNIHHFFDRCIDTDTIYIRIDDDIVWTDDNFIETICDFRLNNPQYFLVFANIINNSVCDYYSQRCGMYSYFEPFKNDCVCPVGWGDPLIAEKKHHYIINKYLVSKTPFPITENVETNDRVSINCISWLGEEFSQFDGLVDISEEIWLSSVKPKELNKTNCIVGSCRCVHYAFFPQRSHLDSTNVLSNYEKLVVGDFY